MSLINDALKRAKEAQRKNVSSGVTPMRPIEVRRRERDFSVFLPVLIILLLVAAVFFIGLALASRKEKMIVVGPAISVTQTVGTVAGPAINPPADVSPAPPPVIGSAAINTNAPRQTRIQGIVYDPVHPWAIINGKTVYVGDFVDGRRVTAISHSTITLAGNGRTNTFNVGDR